MSLPESGATVSRWSRLRPALLPAAATALVAAAIVTLTVVSGTMDSTNATLVAMGFDQDRAQLITSLIVGGIAAAAAVIVANRADFATLAGLGGFVALFVPTFVGETNNALTPTLGAGSFDLVGWLLTVLTLPTIGFIASWSGSTLARAVRPTLVQAGLDVATMVRGRRLERRLAVPPLRIALALALLAVTVPVFGDMVNYTPDTRMLQGGAPLAGLAGAPDDPNAGSYPLPSAANPTDAGAIDATTPGDSAGPGDSTGPTAGASSATPAGSQQPWLAWTPTGHGSMSSAVFAAPWKGVPTKQLGIDVYTPPGYSATGTRRYPVIYEADYAFNSWDHGVNITAVMDSLIDSGAIPPTIVVFMGTNGAPYPDTECANSFDGREWINTYMSQTVPAYLDSHYLTIANPGARAMMGFSQGAYCAATLVLQHPGVFGSAIAFSGYYRAGWGAPASGNPFNNDNATELAASPTVLVKQVPAVSRSGLFFVLIANPKQTAYGPRAAQFAATLKADGYGCASVAAQVDHGWVQVRQTLPTALEDWAGHLGASGVLEG